MITAQDLQEQLEQIDVQILRLLKDRTHLCTTASEEEDEILEDASDTVALWIEEAAEHGLNEAVIEKMAKLATLLPKRVEE